MGAIKRTLFVAFESIAVATFLVMLGSSILQVVFRYVLNLPLMWTEELARLMCILTTYFGGVVVLIAREHIRVDLIDGLLGPRSRRALSLFSGLLIGWFLTIFAYGCWLMADATWTTETATMAWFRTGYIYSAVGIAAVAMLVVVVIDFVADLTAIVRREDAERAS